MHNGRINTKPMDSDLTYSQVGQDRWVLSQIPKGFFVDIAAGDGIDLSNTYLLEQNGWEGLCVEPGDNFNKLTKNRKCTCVKTAVWKSEGLIKFKERGYASYVGEGEYISAITIRTLFKEFNVPKVIDYVSLDIEGSEYEALLGFPWEYRVKLWTIEHNHAKDGGRLKEQIKGIMTAHGYRIAVENVYCGDDPFEDWWVNEELVKGQ